MSGNVPMSNPELMLACHQPFGLARGACIVLSSGRVLASSGAGVGYSDDDGITWCEPYEGRYADGSLPKLMNLVELADGVIGAVELRKRETSGVFYNEHYIAFLRSEDMGKTWSDGELITDAGRRAYPFQNALLRISSGRLILPVYAQYGWGKPPPDERIITGGYLDGEWVATGAHCHEATIGICYVLYSDDNGDTWQPSRGELVIYTDDGAFHGVFEPSVAEVEPGTLLMFMRNLLGRIYESWSYDHGETWSPPQPTQLAASGSPPVLKKLPVSNHLLCVWNQLGPEEIKRGYFRTRLSAAVSRNGGGLWEFFQNVESVHETRRVEPGPIEMMRPLGQFNIYPDRKAYENDPQFVVDLEDNYGNWTNHSACVLDDRVLILYGSRCKVLPLKWFYRGRDPQTPTPLLQKLMYGRKPAQ